MNLSDRLAQLKGDTEAKNLKAGQEFLAANKAKPGVTELPSGLQYEVLTEGSGPKPTEFNTVTCHYHGTLIDGTVFDSSVNRGKPASFPLNMVIKGWTEGLQLMGTGSKWRFFIPPHLGYGNRQVGPVIGPNSTLVFDVELISIN
ncbi:FKBP-type peptidyl-prolyl cis-trans isomerase [Nemorincola caseinilytica]|uniref:Peptidyl-prolyl cis-trans isomerase n=1 Tax=Nemorincola caseinilytica TaxID=2054315 RepID=A0ABP8N7Y1_9BACT